MGLSRVFYTERVYTSITQRDERENIQKNTFSNFRAEPPRVVRVNWKDILVHAKLSCGVLLVDE